MRVVHYKSKSDMDVQFMDDFQYIKKHTTYQNFKNGSIKNPYDRIICGVGYLGDGFHQTGTRLKKTCSYDMWTTMIHRCYGGTGSYPAYNGRTTVCVEWHNFQSFADWHDKNIYTVDGRLHLDKDILVPGNTEYSPSKCLLVPQRINMMFANKANSTGLPSGIRRTNNDKYTTICNGKHLGTFSTIEEAYSVYASVKERHIKDVADEFKAIIPNKLYDALYNYKVLSKNDKNYSK